MGATAWRKALHFTVDVQRNTTTRTTSGASRFNYATVLTGVLCSIQSGGSSRLKQDDVGQDPGKKHDAIFGEEMLGLLQNNDLIVVRAPIAGEVFRLVHVHDIVDPNAPHVECSIESWVPAGTD